MNAYTVFYDADCGLCSAFKKWLQAQPAWIELRFIPLQEAASCPQLAGFQEPDLARELHVLTGEGRLYRGAPAWVMCLYALKTYRPWSHRLAHPALLPFAQAFCEALASRRLALSALLRLKGDRELVHTLRNNPPACTTQCRLP